MRTRLSRLGAFGGAIAAVVAFCYFGRSYLWPIQEAGVIQTVGIIEAQEVNITSRIGGRIAALSLDEGDTIEPSQVVCRIEDVDIKNQLAKADADLANAVAELNNAEITKRRNQGLFAENVVSTQAYDDAVARAAKDGAAVKAAQATLRY